jgi:hypothetical protein
MTTGASYPATPAAPLSRELRDTAAASRWMAAGVCLMRLGPPGPGDVSAVARQLLAAVSESSALPPVGVIGDVGKLIGGAALDFSAPLPSTLPEVAASVRSYEDQFLGRLAQDPKIDAIADAVAKLPKGIRDDAVALLVARVLARIGFQDSVSMSPGIARRVIEVPSDEILEAGYAALREASDVLKVLAAGYAGLVHRARRTGALLFEADVFVLENLTVLSSLTQRLAIEQIVEVSEELMKRLPKRMKPRANRAAGRTPTNIEDEDRYPIGGFSSISTAGSIENLVTSELIYMDDDEGPAEADRTGPRSLGVDLFDMRYVEGELLYYTRDESVFIRSRRVVTFVFEPELARARFKDVGMQWQRLVVAMGLLSASVQKLAAWLSEEGLSFRVAFVRSNGEAPLAPEMGLCQILLREWIDKEMATVVEVDGRNAILDQVEIDAKTAQADVVDLTMAMRPPEDLDPRVRLALVNVAEPSPVLWWTDHPASSLTTDAEPWPAWNAVVADLLQSIIDGK